MVRYARPVRLLAGLLLGGPAFYPTLPLRAQDPGIPAISSSAALERAAPDMRAVLAKLKELGTKPVHVLSVEEARRQPTPGDAVKALLRDRAMGKYRSTVTTQETSYKVGGTLLPLRIYRPAKLESSNALPVIIYFHGGGWVIGNIDAYDASARAIAEKTNAIVVSADYNRAPERRFPAAHLDTFAAYRWVLQSIEQFGGDSRRVAVAGESAGGNLAINVAIKARAEGVRLPVHMLLIYPVAGTDTNTPSYLKNAGAIPLGKADMAWFFDKALATSAQRSDPRLELIAGADLGRLPPTTIITAEIDPLQSEGRALAERLRLAGVSVTHEDFEGVTHEFFGMSGAVGTAVKAQELAARELLQSFSQNAGTGAGDGASSR